MTETFACFIDHEGQLESFNHKGMVAIYKKEGNKWKISKFMGIDLSETSTISELREMMENLLKFLEGTKVIIVRSISGMPYYTLEKAEFGIWESEGVAIDVLEDLKNELDSMPEDDCSSCSKYSETDTVPIPAPVQVGEGEYLISLKEIQGNPSRTTSKQMVMPLLINGQFKKLDIICNHVPPWLEISAMEYGYEIKTEKKGISEYEVMIENRKGAK